MKKLLLLSILCVIAIAVSAQPRNKVVSGKKFMDPHKIENISADPISSSTASMPVKDLNLVGNSSNRTLAKIPIGSSYNIWSLTHWEQSSLTANQDLNMVAFTHRQCASYPDYLGGSGASGWIQTSFSVNNGDSFDSSLVIYDNAMADPFNAGRYPQGGIYNPPGNTDPSEAYSVVLGYVLHESYPAPSASWDGNQISTMKLDSTNGNVQKFLWEPEEIDTVALLEFFKACDNGTFHASGYQYYPSGTGNAYITPRTAIIYDGMWIEDENLIEWDVQYLQADYVEDYNDNPQGMGTFGLTYSQDGEIGYCVWTGTEEDTPNPLGIWPVVYKSENGGEDWDLMETYDFQEIPSIYDSLVPVQGGSESRPYFETPSDVLVDANGQLHIFCYVHSAWSDNPDSVYYYTVFGEDPDPENNKLRGLLYDVYSKPDGTWDALPVSWVHSEDQDRNDAADITARTARPQMSKTQDGTKVFYVWLDTDFDFDRYNIYPDVYAMSFDVTGNGWTKKDSITRETLYWADNNVFMFVSDIAFDNGDGTYSVPVSTHRLTQNNPDPNADYNPVYHTLLKGVDFSDDDYPYVGIDKTPTVSNMLSVSQNYPNPFDNTSIVKVELQEASELTLQVYNLMGQIVYEYSTGQVFAGAHQLTIDAGHLTEGVYFYTVKAGKNSVTHKMIVD